MTTPFKYLCRIGGVFALAGIFVSPTVLPTVARADMKSGIAAYRSGDYKTALAEFSALAEAGNPNAQFSLAVLYLSGRGVKRDVAKAIELHREAARQGLVAAEHGLGVFYYQGMGVKQDYAEALKWFGRAASKGFAESEFNLGVMYFNAEGVPRDEIEVVKWISLAAARKFAPAQYRMGQMYELGVIFAKNPESALHWYRQAEANGNRQAAAALARIAKSLSAAAPPPPPPRPSPEKRLPELGKTAARADTPAEAPAENAKAPAPPIKPVAVAVTPARDAGTIAKAAPVAPPPSSPPAPLSSPATAAPASVSPPPPTPAPPTPTPALPSKPPPPPVDGWKNPFSLAPLPEAPATASTSVAERPAAAPSDPPADPPSETPSGSGTGTDAPPVKGPEWRVQFAAYRSAAEAERALASLNERAGAAIGRTPRIIDVADTGERGVFHRIQAGPLDNAEAANELCILVKAVLPQQACVPLQVGKP